MHFATLIYKLRLLHGFIDGVCIYRYTVELYCVHCKSVILLNRCVSEVRYKGFLGCLSDLSV